MEALSYAFGGTPVCAEDGIILIAVGDRKPFAMLGACRWIAKAQGLAHYIMAVCHDLNGESAQAISEYQKSVKSNGLESAPRLKLGAYYLRLDQIDQATAQLKAVTRISPQESQAHYLLALIYSSEHKYDLAASEYEIILKNAAQDDPANTDVYMYLGQLYYAQAKISSGH